MCAQDFEYHLHHLRKLHERENLDAEAFRWYFGYAKTQAQTAYLVQAMQPIPGGSAPNLDAWRQIIAQARAII